MQPSMKSVADRSNKRRTENRQMDLATGRSLVTLVRASWMNWLEQKSDGQSFRGEQKRHVVESDNRKPTAKKNRKRRRKKNGNEWQTKEQEGWEKSTPGADSKMVHYLQRVLKQLKKKLTKSQSVLNNIANKILLTIQSRIPPPSSPPPFGLTIRRKKERKRKKN